MKLIRGLRIKGKWKECAVELKESVREFFVDHFANKKEKCAGLPECLRGNKLNTVDRQMLEEKFEVEEIKRAVWDCGLDKCPGPDGFNFYFFR